MALVILNTFSEFANWGKKWFVKKWNNEFWLKYSNQNKWTTSGGDPEYSFPFEFRPKFPESTHRFRFFCGKRLMISEISKSSFHLFIAKALEFIIRRAGLDCNAYVLQNSFPLPGRT